MYSIQQFIERNFTLMLFVGIALGLFAPYADAAPAYAPIILVSGVMFFSCSKIRLADMHGFNIKTAASFLALRFMALPALIYYAALPTLPDYALGMLLIALMPVGVASTAMAGMTGGNASIALLATVLTSVLTPFLVPAMLWLVSGEQVQLDTSRIFITLAITVLVPSFLYFFGARKNEPTKAWVERNTTLFTTLLLCGMAASIIGMQRDYILNNPDAMLRGLVIATVFYLLLYAVGWLFAMLGSLHLRDIKTYAICSGSNNIALAAALSVLYFPPQVIVFAVMGEIAWIFGVAAFKWLMETPRFRGVAAL
jgi:bile acid:Na+ symporter, BASS family